MKNKQTINCEVHSCKYCDCSCNKCQLSEIDVKNQKNVATEKDETICSSYKLNKEKIDK